MPTSLTHSVPTLRINLLGTPQALLYIDDNPRAVQLSPAALNVLACLAAHAPKALSRTKLTGLLYPDHQTASARKALADATYHLNKELNDALAAFQPTGTQDWLTGDANATRLNPSLIRIDVIEFKDLHKSSQLADWEQALALYEGDLLEDRDDEWIEPLRRPLQELHLSLLERTCNALSQCGRVNDALTVAQRWVQADPLSDEAHMAAMRLYARQNRYISALQQFDRLARTLKTEMNLEPKPAARDLAQAIRDEAMTMERNAHIQPDKPFVGRASEYAQLMHAMERAQAGQGDLILVEGESGIGKTRLLEKVADNVRWRGWALAWGRTQQHSTTSPCAPLDEALRAAIHSRTQADHLRSLLAPALVELLASMVPALLKTDLHQDAPPSPLVAPYGTANADTLPEWSLRQVDLADAAAEGLLALAKFAPQIIVLDDVQWADNSLWDVLRKLTPLLADHPILLVLSYRDAEIRQNEAAWHALQDLDVQLRLQPIRLRGFNTAECSQLALKFGKHLSQHELANLREATQGKPLFVAGVVGANSGASSASGLHAGAGEGELSAPTVSSFQAMFEGKLISLTPQERNGLEAAAVLGREFSATAWQAVAAQPIDETAPRLRQLDLVMEGERGYKFSHDFVHEQVYAAIGPERLRTLHKRAAAALQTERAEPGVLAWHCERAGAWREAVRHHRRAGDKAEAAYAYNSALKHYDQALSIVTNLELQEMKFSRLHVLCSRQLVYGMQLDLKKWQADIEAIEALSEDLGGTMGTMGLMTALEARMTLAFFASDMAGVGRAGDRALALAKAQGNRRAEARIANILGMHLASRVGQAERARKLLQGTVAFASANKDSLLLVSALCNLSGAQRHLGECNTAKDNALHALTLSQLDQQLYAARADALHALGCAEWYLARWQAAHTALAAASQLHSTLNNMWAALDDMLNFALLNTQMGDFDAAILTLQQLQSLARRVGLAADSDLWKWGDALLADVYVLSGELDKAEQLLLGMADWMDRATEGRQLLSALQTHGRLLLERGEHACALKPLEKTKAIWQREQTVQVEPLLLHALAAHWVGDGAAARASLKLAEQRVQRSDAAFAHVHLHWVRHVVLADGAALSQARDELHRQAKQFDDPAQRARFLANIQLHRHIEAAWQAHTQSAKAADPAVRQAIVRLARQDVPLGRKLTDEDRVDVTWTLDAGAADAIVMQQEGKVGLRQHRLRRLLEEAQAQGAAPTDEDLAKALDVQVRTIERDMKELGKQVRGLTRRR